MNLRIELKGGAMTASMRGELDHHTAGEMREQIDSTAKKVRPQKLILDFKEVPFMDSSGIGLILGRVRTAALWGGRVKENGGAFWHLRARGAGRRRERSENMKQIINRMELRFPSGSVNESFARGAVSAFVLCLDPLVTDLNDLKTAVSEAVTNAIVHGYRDTIGTVYITAVIYADGTVQVKVRDRGCGIPDIEKAMEPLFTTGGEERAGLGFAVMQSFCDSVRVISKPQKGTTVTLTKRFERKPNGE